jgi:cysteinyl-tRNA synthetase
MPELRLYNTLTRTKEVFRPIDPKRVRMYACGPTVYDLAHIGNARPIIVFDLLFRLLRHLYGPEHVTYVRNVTDVEDKINARAHERGISIRELTDGTLAQFHEDVRALGVLEPTVEPRATDYIEEMKAIIHRLHDRGVAYVAEDHVLFSPKRMDRLAAQLRLPRYGSLARRPLDEMSAGARVDVAPYKEDETDFVLWKPSTAGQPGWPSPLGIEPDGRPGWHIECSAMSMATLLTPFGGGLGASDPTANTFDIHGGGIDLVFPHHENEIAQSCCAFGTERMANIWMHNGFLQVEGEKMSKSLGNFVTIRELVATDSFGGRAWPGDVIRLAMLRTHYRQPIDWSERALEESYRTWISFGNIVRENMTATEIDSEFLALLSDDLNTPAALSRLFELREAANRGDARGAQSLSASLRMLGFFENAFGLKLQISYSHDELAPDEIWAGLQRVSGDLYLIDIAQHFQSREPDSARDFIGFLLTFDPNTTVADIKRIEVKPRHLLELDAKRRAARAAKNWPESDRIRDELAAMGIRLKDNKDGTTTWEVVR